MNNKKNSKPRPKKGYSTRKKPSLNDKERDERESNKLGNDISWYVADTQILNDVASLPFSNVLSDSFTQRIATPQGPNGVDVTTPGICVIKYAPSYGFAYNYKPSSAFAKTDPLNIATKSVYSFVRKHNSGSANYDEVDLMQYYLAMDSVYSYWAYLVRLYGVLRVYNYKNRYLPNALLGAMGFPSATAQKALYGSMAQLRYVINNMALRMSSLAVPTVMPIFQRHVWMNSNIFKDCDDPKAQMYLFKPEGYYVYNEEDGTLDWTDLTDVTTNAVLTTIQTHIDNMLQPLLYSQSIGIMSGDTLKAYEGNVYTFGTINEDFTVLPMYNEKILPQIHNLNTVSVKPTYIEQDDNALICRCVLRGANYYDNVEVANDYKWQYDDLLLNMPYNNPNPEDVMYATRLMTNLVSNGVEGQYIVYAASEIPTSISYIDNSEVGSTTMEPEIDRLSSRSLVLDTSALWPDYTRLINISAQFDWGPRIAVFYLNEELNDLIDYYPCSDIANFTTVSNNFLSNIHQSALCGLFGIPYTLKRA